jgi:hypothetical protein
MNPTPGRRASAEMPEPRLLFVNGFHRSGTTVMTSAVTDAIGGTTTTVGVLGRSIPTLGAFLDTHVEGTVDRGADHLHITAQTAEEYGFLLAHRTGTKALYGHPDGLALLREHVAELAADAPGRAIVLKNPWEVGHEAKLLTDFPTARIIILRRRIADIERSMGKALVRASSSAYSRALESDSDQFRRLEKQLASRWRRRLLLRGLRLTVRGQAYRLCTSVRSLAPDRVAFLSYDELRADAANGAAWAAHVIDPDALAEAFSRHAFTERGTHVASTPMQRALDRRWRRTWREMRAIQVETGLLRPPREHRRSAHASNGQWREAVLSSRVP